MKVIYDTKLGGFYVRWDEVEGATYRVAVQKTTEGRTDDLFVTEANYPFLPGWEAVGYAAQESNYYDDILFHVEAIDRNGKTVSQADGPVFKVTDFFPKEKEREIGDRKIRSFSYRIGTHSSMTMEKEPDSLQNCHIYNNGSEISFEASYTAGRNLKEVSRKLKEKDWEEVLSMLKKGKLVRKRISDPNLIVLDGGSPEQLDITTDKFDRLENRFYELDLSKENKDELLTWITRKCE